LLPWLKIVNIQAKQVKCGSAVSNNVAENKLKADPSSADTGYPFKNEKCYSSYVKGDFETDPIPDGMKDGV